MVLSALTAALLVFDSVRVEGNTPPSTAPHNYTGIPKQGYGPVWQDYFWVTKQLPNITFDLGRQWAGNLPVERRGFPNDTLFFWGFEKENGSLTVHAGERENEPWAIWLNGGPGTSSMVGLLWENGPIHITPNGSMYPNKYSWHHIADYFWLDQPVGTGFSTASSKGYIPDEDQMAKDFWGFVSNLVKVFPSLATRPLYLTGESYAGTYIPYIMKGYFSLPNPPAKLVKVAIGNGAMANAPQYQDASMLSVIETLPQLIGYDPDVYDYFVEQTHLCGFDLNLTYPQRGGHFPTLYNQWENTSSSVIALSRRLSKKKTNAGLRSIAKKAALANHRRARRDLGRRGLEGRANGTIDPWYLCSLLDEVWDYAVNYTIPWSISDPYDNVDPYDVPDALSPEAPGDPTTFLNDRKTILALHAPTSLTWVQDAEWVFQSHNKSVTLVDPSVFPVTFFDDLAANMSDHNVSLVIYSGNDDSLVAHWSSEVIIQNTTFGGTQGFSRKPSTEWTTDDGEFAGIVHQERNWTYALVYGASHLVPQYKPAAAYVLAREFVFGTNQTGLVTDARTPAIGGETANLTGTAHDVLIAAPGIYVGSGTTTSTVVAPSSTVAAWVDFLATRLGSVSASGTSVPRSDPPPATSATSRASSALPTTSMTGKKNAAGTMDTSFIGLVLGAEVVCSVVVIYL